MTRKAIATETLGNEVHVRSPRTTLYFYDDTPQRDSDHDPNLHGVVCGLDIMAGYGLDLHSLSREIVATRHPECAYVIYNRQIASRNTNWQWVTYTGSNPHTDHIHVSVGVGRDGYKEPPYDSRQSWLGDDMPYTPEQMRAFPWQYAGNGMPGVPPGKSTLWVLGSIYTFCEMIAKNVGIDPAELLAIQEAAEAGAREAVMASVDEIVAGVLAGLPEGTLTQADVEQAVRNVLLQGVEQ